MTKSTSAEEAAASDAQPSPTPPSGSARRAPIAPDARVIQFSFVSAPWEQVLRWFADTSGLSLQMDVKPTGTFNYIKDPQSYTLGEAMDILNAQLVPRGFTLIHKNNYLKVIALEDKIPPDLIPRVTPEELEERGESEFVSVIFPLKNIAAKTAADEVKEMKGQYGSVVALESVNRLMVTDTAGNARLIKGLLDQIDALGAASQSKTRIFQLKYTSAGKVEMMLREVLGLAPRTTATQAPDANARGSDRNQDWRDRMRRAMQGGFGGVPPWMQPPGGDGGEQRGDEQRRDRGGAQPAATPPQPTVYLAVDDRLNQIIVTGPPDKLAIAEEVITKIDTPREGDSEFTAREPQSPTVRVYRLSDGDAQSLVTALQAIYQTTPTVRFSADQSNNAVVAVATPDDQEAIARLVEQFEHDERDLAVLPLSVLDASAMTELLGAVYASGQRDWRGNAVPRAGEPRIEADLGNNRLVVRGSKKQVEDIRTMLGSLGEPQMSLASGSERIRVLPMPSQNAQSIAATIEQIWPKMRPGNPIRIIEPGKKAAPNAPDTAPGSGNGEPTGASLRIPERVPRSPSNTNQRPRTPPAKNAPDQPSASDQTGPDSAAALMRLVTHVAQNGDETVRQKPTDSAPPAPEEPAAPEDKGQAPKGAPVVIAVGPDNLVIASDDPEALAQLANLIQSMTRATPGGSDYTVFYLKSADATQIQQTLSDLLGLSTLSLLSGTRSRSSLHIVPDTRTNALIVSGTPADVTRVSQLLEVLDRNDAPSSGAMSAPRIIPVRYSSATAIAQVIREVYASQVVTGAGGPSGFRGFTVSGFGGGGSPMSSSPSPTASSSRGNSRSGTLAIGVDERSNSVVVSCSEALFKEVSLLVETLDQAANDTQRTVKIVTVRNSTPSAVQDALNGLMGIQPRTTRTGTGTTDMNSPFRTGFGGPGGFTPGGFPFGGGGFPGGGSPGGDQNFGGRSDGRSFDRGMFPQPGGSGNFRGGRRNQ